MKNYLMIVMIVLGATALAACPAAGPQVIKTEPIQTDLENAIFVTPTETPPPLASLIAQGIPADSLIEKSYSNDFLQFGAYQEIRITGDGSASVESCPQKEGVVCRSEGRISDEALRRVILAFDENDFFSLAVDDDGCVYDITDPTAASASKEWVEDAGRSRIAIIIGGSSWSLSYPNGCRYMDGNGTAGERKLDALLSVIEGAVKDLPQVSPTATPTPAEVITTTAQKLEPSAAATAAAGSLFDIPDGRYLLLKATSVDWICMSNCNCPPPSDLNWSDLSLSDQGMEMRDMISKGAQGFIDSKIGRSLSPCGCDKTREQRQPIREMPSTWSALVNVALLRVDRDGTLTARVGGETYLFRPGDRWTYRVPGDAGLDLNTCDGGTLERTMTLENFGLLDENDFPELSAPTPIPEASTGSLHEQTRRGRG